MLCSDLLLRSTTAATVRPVDYDSERRELHFRTKHAHTQTLPVTAELHALFVSCAQPEVSFVAQLPRARHKRSASNRAMKPLGRMSASSLRRQFNNLKAKLGISAELHPHDLRRTTARAVYELTGDLRAAQAALGHHHLHSTLHYLQDVKVQVSVDVLELAKLNPLTEVPQ
jgi:site-specific recombinase XerC